MEETAQEPRKYEIMLILSGEISEAEFAKEFDNIKKMIAQFGASIWHTEPWGLRRLTYRLKRMWRGYYGILNFDALSDVLPQLRESLRINPLVLRTMITSLPPNYVPGKHQEEVIPKKKAEDGKEQSQLRQHRKVEPQILTRVPVVPVEEKAPTPLEQTRPLTTQEQEEKLKNVERKLDEILDNPDIDIS